MCCEFCCSRSFRQVFSQPVLQWCSQSVIYIQSMCHITSHSVGQLINPWIRQRWYFIIFRQNIKQKRQENTFSLTALRSATCIGWRELRTLLVYWNLTFPSQGIASVVRDLPSTKQRRRTAHGLFCDHLRLQTWSSGVQLGSQAALLRAHQSSAIFCGVLHQGDGFL